MLGRERRMLVETPAGIKLHLDPLSHLGARLLQYDTYEPGTEAIFRKYIDKESVVVDFGSATGRFQRCPARDGLPSQLATGGRLFRTAHGIAGLISTQARGIARLVVECEATPHRRTPIVTCVDEELRAKRELCAPKKLGSRSARCSVTMRTTSFAPEVSFTWGTLRRPSLCRSRPPSTHCRS